VLKGSLEQRQGVVPLGTRKNH